MSEATSGGTRNLPFEEEYAEEVRGKELKTGWPKPLDFAGEQPARWRVVYESYNQSVEELYFSIHDILRLVTKFHSFDKLTDIFAASEQSAFFGVAQQRLGLQQDKVSQFLATIGKMIKELFQLVRELRIIDERLAYYLAASKGDLAAEITLKGYWIDLVEGGAKNPASVYGMARELQFVTLPDIFFGAPAMPSAGGQEYVEGLEFNRKVREVLMRKLKSFLIWKEYTYRELRSRRTFTIKYLRQHYDIIRMYMAWVKPYLRNIRRMQLDITKMDSTELISAFEGSMIEIEFLAKSSYEHGVWGIIDVHFLYRSRPELRFQQEGYQRGPIHVGRTQMTLRGYAWTDEEVKRYKKHREQEDMDLLRTIDGSVQAAYEALGDELQKYLAEAEAQEEHIPEGQGMHHTIFNPFASVFKGVAELTAAFLPNKKPLHCGVCKTEVKPDEQVHCGVPLRAPSRREALAIDNEKRAAADWLEREMYQIIKRFKAQHGMIY